MLPHQVNWTLKCVCQRGGVSGARGQRRQRGRHAHAGTACGWRFEAAGLPGGIIHLTAHGDGAGSKPSSSVSLQRHSRSTGRRRTRQTTASDSSRLRPVVEKYHGTASSVSVRALTSPCCTATTQHHLNQPQRAPTGCARTESGPATPAACSPASQPGGGQWGRHAQPHRSAPAAVNQFKSDNLAVTAATAASGNANKDSATGHRGQEAAPVWDAGSNLLCLARGE